MAHTVAAANNYASDLISLERFKEAKTVLRKTLPVARRVLGESHELTLRMRTNNTTALVNADGATLDDLREGVATLEDTDRIARRTFGGAHPLTLAIEHALRQSRAALHACETPPPPERP